jgi:hypothetical protein
MPRKPIRFDYQGATTGGDSPVHLYDSSPGDMYDQHQFHPAISHVTGESPPTIERLGFSLLDSQRPQVDAESLHPTP